MSASPSSSDVLLVLPPEPRRPIDRRFMPIASYAVQSLLSNAFSPHPDGRSHVGVLSSFTLLGIALVYRNRDAIFLPSLSLCKDCRKPAPGMLPPTGPVIADLRSAVSFTMLSAANYSLCCACNVFTVIRC